MKFGDEFVNPFASDENPRKIGYFVRWVYRRGRMNPGKHMELTDRKRDFWLLAADINEDYAEMYPDAPAPQDKDQS